MGLSEFIQENKEAITEDWVIFAREHILPARHMNLAGLRDHINGILQFIVNDLDSTGQPPFWSPPPIGTFWPECRAATA